MTIFMGNGNYETQILDAIQLLVDDAVSKANYDKTIQATISRCVDATIGKYVVKYQGNSFYAYSYNTDVSYPTGTAVYVLIPGNDMKQEKSIIGTVDKLGIDYVSIIEGENGYEVTGVNTINSQITFGLCSYKIEDIELLYDRDNGVDLINLDTFGLESYIKQSSSIICGATFRTNLSTEQKVRGDYGIVFSLDFIDNATGETVTRQYLVNIDKMTGQPYNFTTASRQYGIFEVDGSNFISVKQIYIFSYDFPNTIEGDSIEREDDIFISKIELSAANALDSIEAGTAALTFITPGGTYFDETHLDTDSKIIEAQVRIKGQAIDNDSQDVEYYWFRENNKISTKSQAYNKHGGAGWECLNENNIIQEATDDSEALVEWVPATYRYITTKAENIAKETKYKCVAVYNNEITLSKTIIIYNYSSDYELSIVSDDGTTFYYDLGNPTLTCKVNGVEELEDEYEYVWSSIDNNNIFTNIYETTDANIEYNDALEKYNILIEQINSNNVLANSVQEELLLYKRILDQYEYIMRVEKNKIHQLKVSGITNFTTYRCSVYKSGIAIGTASIIISNNLKNESNYSVIINNGNQVFKYNENGIAPNNKSLENPITILPLTFTVYDNEGREVSTEAIGLKNIKWIVPTENTLLTVNSGQGNPSEITDSTETYSGLENFNFSIYPRYNINKDNNIIQLLINYKEKILTARTNFTFTKTGEIGTNGTDFICKIVPNIQSGSVAPANPTLIYNEYLKTYSLNYDTVSTDKWFKAQLWHDGEQIFEGTSSGTSSENIEAKVTWSILKNNYGNNIVDESNLTIGSSNGSITFDTTEYEHPANIVKCVINYNGVDYYATIPVIVSRVQSADYEILLTEQTGFKSVMYTADGQTPVYDSEKPHEITVYQMINGVKENISLYEPETYRVDYDWTIKGNVYYSDWQSSSNLIKKTLYTTREKRNQKYFKPSDTYNGLCVNNAVVCTITRGDELIGSIHIPIHLYINRYGNSAMNGWDGNSISFDNEGGLILAPQVGAGIKNEDNSFTGVFMGSVKEAGATKEEHGLFGYSSGQRTITLNSEDGSARFGKTGAGQIIIDPSTGEALLTSGNYDEEAGTGMEINLSEPSIKFGSGKFAVSADGTVTAEAFATKQSVQELEEAVSLFNVNFNFDSIIVPCDSNNTPLDSGGYEIAFEATYKNNSTTGYQVELISGEYDGISTTLSDNAIVFDVSTKESITNTVNVYSLKFTYTDIATFKTYVVNKNITVALAIQGKDGVIGVDGKSAYQIWLDAGNTGTEEDYLASLKGADGAQGENGEDGKSAYEIWLEAGNTGTEEEYLASLKGTDGRSAYEIAVAEGFEGTEEDWLVSLIGKDGPQGIQGETGEDGKTSYTHFAYANSADGTEDFSITDGLNKIYLGQYSDFNEDDSTEPSDYTWSLIKGSDGKDGEQGIQGETGIGVSSIVEQYYLSTSNQSQTGGSWINSQPDWKSGYYIWTRSEITWTDGNVTHTDPILADAINKANETANTASSAANDAKDVANNASTAANEAKTEAATATSTANSASSTANSALEKATTTESELANLTTVVNNNYSDLQNQIDGAISTWFGDHVPTNDNYPAEDWATEELEAHVGDLFYITSGSSSGQCYRYVYMDNAYQWIIIEDADVAKALASAATAQATADGKATVYTGTTTPSSPSEGDLWLKSEDDAILTYVDGKWVEYNKYTAAAQAAQDTADAATETANTAKDTADNASTTASEAKTTANTAITTVQTTVKEVDVQYAISSSSQIAPTTGWSTDAPTWVDGQYIWSRNVTTYVNGTTSEGEAVCITGGKGATGTTGATGDTGATGVGVSTLTELYYLSNSNSTTPTKPTAHVTSTSTSNSVWTTKCPTWSSSYPYYWTCTEIEYTNNTYGWSTPVLASGLNSANSTANTANTNASNAVTTANTANTNATNAITTANAASTKADTATSTANTAKTTAEAAQTTANTANSTATAAKDAIDNLEIGGRNYFSHKTQIAFNEDGTYTLKDYQNTGSFTQFYNLTKDMSYFVGKECYLSFDVISPNGSTPFKVYNTNGNPRYAISVKGVTTPISTTWVSQKIKVTVTDRGETGYTESTSNKIEMYGSEQMGVQVRNVKFEIGTTTTDWTPAPEDTLAEMDNLVESTTLQYCIWDTPSGTNPPGNDAEWSNSATILSDIEANQYVWIRTKYIFKSGAENYSSPTCLLYSQKRLVEQYTQYLLWNKEKDAPAEDTSYTVNSIVYTWSKDKPTQKLNNYSYLWTRTCKVYKYIGETAEAEAPEYSEYHLDPTWNILFDLDQALEDAITDITNKIGSGFARIQDGTILIGNDLTSPTKLILMNQNGIAFFEREANGAWPTAEELSKVGTSTWSIDGTLNMKDITVNDLNASNIQNQNLVLGATNDNGATVSGDFDIYDSNKNIMFETVLDSTKTYVEGFKIYKRKLDSSTGALTYDGYIFLSREYGLLEYNAGGNIIYGHNGSDTFAALTTRTKQFIITDKGPGEDTTGESGIQMIPMSVDNTGDGLTHTGVAFIKL